VCPFVGACAAQARGDPARFPRKAKKREGRLRRGAAYVAIRADGHVLVRRRPAKGLLGGMTEVPTSDWVGDFDNAQALAQAPCFEFSRAGSARDKSPQRGDVSWRRIPGVVIHVFTHFPLELTVFTVRLPDTARAPDGMRWLAPEDIAGAALPSLMRKVLAHARIAQPRTD
jgi:A/G-specific adenine glycosylase